MRKIIYSIIAFILLSSHTLYLKVDSYFLQPNQQATLSLYNGSFETSENIISRDRIIDASFMVNGSRRTIDANLWQDQDSTITQLTFSPDKEGTYVAGVSTKARNIKLKAEKFNNYLIKDGLEDMLEQRTQDSLLDQDAVESYQKHVKAIYQVGNTKTNDWRTPLGYPIEFIPQENPYQKFSGESLDVKLVLDNQPLTNQLVYADHITSGHSHTSIDQNKESHSHDHEQESPDHVHSAESKIEEDHGHSHKLGQKLRTNDQGIVTIDLPEDGTYYIRSIYMTQVDDSDELTHQSNWATLTFGITHKHDSSTHIHENQDEHEHDESIPTWWFILGSIVIVGLLFLLFRKNK